MFNFKKKQKKEKLKKEQVNDKQQMDGEESPSNEANQNEKSKTITEPPQNGLSKTKLINIIKERTNSPADLKIKFIKETITLFHIDFIIETKTLHDQIISKLQSDIDITPQIIKDILPISELDIKTNIDDCINDLLIGAVLIHIDGYSEIVVAKITAYQTRSLAAPENESQVIGAQVGFNESLATNISLVRGYITNRNLCNEKFTVGKETKTTLSVLYIKGIAPDEQVQTVRQRITDLEIADLIDSAVLAELIDDSSKSIFPQLLLTERPDRFCDGLLGGKVGIIINGSSMAIISPFSFIEFFQSREDKNLRWPIATFIRLLRFFAIMVSIFLTPMYVAFLTFHYEVIPQPLLVPLSESRAIVPFPPILEAFLLEIIIELLREAGARLPTKVGQTIGIVGGIVIGTAAVEAGITSNILIIIIALSALASFTTPNYMMGNVIRILRFPIIFVAGIWGFYGIMITICFLLIHLLRLTSLGAPYLWPFYPPRLNELADSIIRLPFSIVRRQKEQSSGSNGSKKDVSDNEK
nr:spore germination protein [Lysinibacillus timonensis]